MKMDLTGSSRTPAVRYGHIFGHHKTLTILSLAEEMTAETFLDCWKPLKENKNSNPVRGSGGALIHDRVSGHMDIWDKET